MIEKYFALKYAEEIFGWAVIFFFVGVWVLLMILYVISEYIKKLQQRRKR